MGCSASTQGASRRRRGSEKNEEGFTSLAPASDRGQENGNGSGTTRSRRPRRQNGRNGRRVDENGFEYEGDSYDDEEDSYEGDEEESYDDEEYEDETDEECSTEGDEESSYEGDSEEYEEDEEEHSSCDGSRRLLNGNHHHEREPNESELSSITSDSYTRDSRRDSQFLNEEGDMASFGNFVNQEFVPPEAFVFSDFDVPTDDVEEKLTKSLQRRDSRFTFGDAELESETDLDSSIVKEYLQKKKKNEKGKVDDSFLWGDVALDNEELTKQHQISKDLAKTKKTVDGVTLHTHIGQPDRIKCLALLPGESVYACCDCNCPVMRTYDCSSGALRLSFIGHQEPITYVCFSPNCKHIATASADGGVVVWDTVTTKAQAILPHPKAVAACVFTGNSRSLVTSCRDSICRTWEIKKKKLLRTYAEHKAFVFALDAHPKFDVIVSGGVDGTIMLWTSLTAVSKAVLRGHTGPVLSAKFSPHGTRIVSNDEASIRIWNTMTTVCIVALSVDVLPCEINTSSARRRSWITSAFCPVGVALEDETLSLHVVVSCSDKSVHVLQASTGKDVFSFSCKAPVYQLAAGHRNVVICGDCFGNITVVTIR